MTARPGFSTDPYMGREYHATRYNCLHFVQDVWLDLTGEDVGDRLAAVLADGSPQEPTMLRAARKAEALRSFRRLGAPEDPCLVLMQRRLVAPHAGVYLRRRVLHLQERGVEFQPPEIARRGFVSLGYYL